MTLRPAARACYALWSALSARLGRREARRGRPPKLAALARPATLHRGGPGVRESASKCITRSGLALLAFALASTAAPAWARSSDRDKPINVDAGNQKGSTDESAPTVFSGGVHITQGTLDIKSSVAELTVKNGDPTRAVFTGSQVVMKQEMDDGAPVTARADKVDYDLTTEIIVFTGNAYMQNPRGSTSGPRITYNMKTGQIESSGDGGGGRVKTTILPKSAQGKK